MTFPNLDYSVKLDTDKTYTGNPQISCGIYNTSASSLGDLTTTATQYSYSSYIKCSVQQKVTPNTPNTPVSCTYNLPTSIDKVQLKISLRSATPSSSIGSYGSCTLSDTY